jgi:putative ABC transport system permease protein
MKLGQRLRMWRDRRRFEQDLAEEIRIHREMSGAPAFGSEALALEQSREVWGFAWLDSWKQDIRYAARGLTRTPGFAIAVIAAIGLGIGLNTTLFTVFNAYVLRPHAVRDPYSLHAVVVFEKGSMGRFLKLDEWESLREQTAVLSDVLAFDNFGADLAGRSVFAQLVSDNYFQMLGVGMELGRPLLPGDDGVMVLGYDAWRNKFGGDPSIVGRKLYIRGQPLEVVGVASARFSGLETVPTSAWIPLRKIHAMRDEKPDVRVVARLRPEITVEQGQSALLPWAKQRWPAATAVSLPAHSTTIPITQETVLVFLPIFTAFGLVLAIACANVSNMMLARGLARQREVAIRVSLGAGRWRLVRQLLTESLILAFPSAVAGFLISEATIEGARRLLFATVPPAFGRIMAIVDLAPDWRVFGYVLAASAATALLFGLTPALQTTRSRIVEANRGDFSSDYRPARLRSFLVVAQVAVCALLLISSAIVLRSEQNMRRQDIGLDTADVWDVRAMPRYQARAAARLREEPAVAVVASVWRAPLYGSLRRIAVTPSGSAQAVVSGYNFVSGTYFNVFRIPVVRGRVFSPEESEAELPMAIVSESTARRFWPGRDAIGETIAIPPAKGEESRFNRWPAYASARVIGVAKDIWTGGEDNTCIYFTTGSRSQMNDSVLVRVSGPQAETRRRIELALSEIAPSVSDFLVPMDDVRALQVYPFQVTFWIAGFLAGVALLLTVTGIYGVMSYVVSQRTKEIGIRVALGAGTPAILWMVLRHSGKLAAIGAAIGGGMALAIAPVFANQLNAIQPYEALPYLGTMAVVFAAAVLASYTPARRAVRIDPVVTLRCD